jgi:aryl-alcohol dehydrogenase-like predicted oxidoreductase
MYTQGESERLLGDAFRRKRQQVVIATKFGYVLPSQGRLGSRIKPLVKPVFARFRLTARQVHQRLRGAVSRQDFSPTYIARAVEDSLRRLRTDYIDLLQLHSPPLDVLQQGDFVQPLECLREQGKIRYWGVACDRTDDTLAAVQYGSIASVQIGFSALEQAALDSAFPGATARGVGIIARQVFASGLLTRRLDAFDPEQIDPDPVVADRKRHQIRQFAAIASEHCRAPDELALKFVLARPEVSAIPVGISTPAHLKATIAALEAPPLTADEQAQVLAARRPGV